MCIDKLGEIVVEHGIFPVMLHDLQIPKPSKLFIKQNTAPEGVSISEELNILILHYCYSVALDGDSFERSLLHKAVCRGLGLGHEEFSPFEDDEIRQQPTPKEAVEMFWGAFSRRNDHACK